jgi:hypothetical protein
VKWFKKVEADWRDGLITQLTDIAYSKRRDNAVRVPDAKAVSADPSPTQHQTKIS